MVWGHLKLGVSMVPVSWRQWSWIISCDLDHSIQTHPSCLPFNDPISWSLWVCKRVAQVFPSVSKTTSQSFSHDQSVRKANKPVNQLMGQSDSQDTRQSVSHSVIPALESDSTEDFYRRGDYFFKHREHTFHCMLNRSSVNLIDITDTKLGCSWKVCWRQRYLRKTCIKITKYIPFWQFLDALRLANVG